MAFAYCVAKLKLFASISATDAKPRTVMRHPMENSDYKRKCNKCGTQMDKEYDTEYHDVFQCPNCEYQKLIQIDECCRKPLKIVIIDNTKKLDRLLYQCINCGGIVNKNKPLSFKEYSDQIRDEINTHRLKEWQENVNFDFQLTKEPINENNFRISNFGKLQEHYATERYRNLRKNALVRDNYKCQIYSRQAEEVHHLTYENFPNEKLEDLQSLCSKCHNEITWKNRFQKINKNN